MNTANPIAPIKRIPIAVTLEIILNSSIVGFFVIFNTRPYSLNLATGLNFMYKSIINTLKSLLLYKFNSQISTQLSTPFLRESLLRAKYLWTFYTSNDKHSSYCILQIRNYLSTPDYVCIRI